MLRGKSIKVLQKQIADWLQVKKGLFRITQLLYKTLNIGLCKPESYKILQAN